MVAPQSDPITGSHPYPRHSPWMPPKNALGNNHRNHAIYQAVHIVHSLTIEIRIVTDIPEFPLPERKTPGSIGADLQAAITSPLHIEPGESRLIPSGIAIALPEGYEAQVRPRSGLALKHQITVLNSPGTIDSDYRGEIGVILINHGKRVFTVEPMMRIAQLIIASTLNTAWINKSALDVTERGSGGFGHTGA